MNFIFRDTLEKYIPFSRDDNQKHQSANWNIVKAKLRKRKGFRVNVREIWWCAVGENIGYEIDGKGNPFSRPVLVIKVISEDMFIGIPLTSTYKNLPGYFKYKDRSLLFEQVRVFSTKRLYTRQAVVSEKQFIEIQKKFTKYINS